MDILEGKSVVGKSYDFALKVHQGEQEDEQGSSTSVDLDEVYNRRRHSRDFNSDYDYVEDALNGNIRVRKSLF